MAITLTTDSATISTSEYFAASDSTTATYQTTDCILQVAWDLSAMAAGDEFRFRIYEKVDGTNVITLFDCSKIGTQAKALVCPCFVVGNGWEASAIKVAGTDRALEWTLAKIT